jgi:hypothetical protein
VSTSFEEVEQTIRKFVDDVVTEASTALVATYPSTFNPDSVDFFNHKRAVFLRTCEEVPEALDTFLEVLSQVHNGGRKTLKPRRTLK